MSISKEQQDVLRPLIISGALKPRDEVEAWARNDPEIRAAREEAAQAKIADRQAKRRALRAAGGLAVAMFRVGQLTPDEASVEELIAFVKARHEDLGGSVQAFAEKHGALGETEIKMIARALGKYLVRTREDETGEV